MMAISHSAKAKDKDMVIKEREVRNTSHSAKDMERDMMTISYTDKAKDKDME